MLTTKVVIAFLSASSLVHCYEWYRAEIPNGNMVPHPCNTSEMWDAVGHENEPGSGPFNPFGVDFKAYGKKWTRALCQKDSDGDGMTNGQELGDPNCVWTKGARPAVTDMSKLSHPGVCEPLGTAGCLEHNKFLMKDETCLNAGVFNRSDWCPAIKGKGVMKMILRLDELNVPANDTSYMCQEFKMPSDDDYQVIAYEPLISNVEIMHHLVNFMCTEQRMITNLDAVKDRYKTPKLCAMAPECNSYSLVWAFGMAPRCYSDDTGVPFGRSFYNRTILQLHYNNPKKRDYYRDSSGIIIYYVRRSRPQNSGSFIVGQTDISIPPKSPLTIAKNKLADENCTQRFLGVNRRYNVTSMLFHMHQAGFYGKLTLRKRSGTMVPVVDQKINYDRPVMKVWSEQYLELEPGDAFLIECHFKTLDRDEWTTFGERTRDEMCLAIFEMFPLPNGRLSSGSIDFGPYNSCDMSKRTINGCTTADFRDLYNRTRLSNKQTFESECKCADSENEHIYPATGCTRKCYDYLNNNGFMNMTQCLKGSVFHMLGVVKDPNDWPLRWSLQGHVNACLQLNSPPDNSTVCGFKRRSIENYDSGDSDKQMGSGAGIMLPNILAAFIFAIINLLRNK